MKQYCDARMIVLAGTALNNLLCTTPKARERKKKVAFITHFSAFIQVFNNIENQCYLTLICIHCI